MNPFAEYKALASYESVRFRISVWQFLLDIFRYTDFKLCTKTDLLFNVIKLII